MLMILLSTHPGLLLVIVFLLIFAVLLLLGQHHRQKRSDAMKEVANAMNLDFYAEDPFRLGQQLLKFELFSPHLINWSHDIQNVIPGVLENTQVFIFDYSYSKSRRHFSSQTVFVAINPQWRFQDFRYRHDRWYEAMRIAQQRRGLPGQLRYYHENANTDMTEEQVREQMPPELQALLTPYKPSNIELKEGCLVIYVPDTIITEKFAPEFYQDCCALVALLESKPNSVQRWAEIRTKDYN